MEKKISEAKEKRINWDMKLDKQKAQIESRIDYMTGKYPDYKDVIEEWKEKNGQKK